jgi:hypothetical protein
VPFLSYASGAYMARLVEHIAQVGAAAAYLEPVYETDMAEGLKAMALEGPRPGLPARQLGAQGPAGPPPGARGDAGPGN